MISSLRQPSISISGSDVVVGKRHATLVQPQSFLPCLVRGKSSRSVVSVNKPLHLACVGVGNFGSVEKFESDESFGKSDLVKCRAYEADGSEVEGGGVGAPSEAAKKVKIGIYFATWWALNVVFNIYNKKVLNAYPYPWLTSTLSLACGSLMMLISWATRIAEAPKTDLEFWKTLFPVSVWFCLFWGENDELIVWIERFVLFAYGIFLFLMLLWSIDTDLTLTLTQMIIWKNWTLSQVSVLSCRWCLIDLFSKVLVLVVCDRPFFRGVGAREKLFVFLQLCWLSS